MQLSKHFKLEEFRDITEGLSTKEEVEAKEFPTKP